MFCMKHKCAFCPKAFAFQNELIEHQKNVHWPGHICAESAKTFKSFRGLKGHPTPTHGKAGRYTCSFEDCSIKFQHKNSYFDHVNKHSRWSHGCQCQTWKNLNTFNVLITSHQYYQVQTEIMTCETAFADNLLSTEKETFI